jgi:hypothetical protein
MVSFGTADVEPSGSATTVLQNIQVWDELKNNRQLDDILKGISVTKLLIKQTRLVSW